MRVEPPPIPLKKGKNDTKSYKYCVRIKLRRYSTPKRSDLYDFKMALFENDEPEIICCLYGTFQMTLKESRTLATGANIQYICVILRGKALFQLERLSIDVVSITPAHLN